MSIDDHALGEDDGSEKDGDWIVNGQKVWTSDAQHAQMAILVARTDPTVSKH